jgi:hypothetical protein
MYGSGKNTVEGAVQQAQRFSERKGWEPKVYPDET